MEELGIAARVKAQLGEVNNILQGFTSMETSAGKVDKAFKNLSQDAKTGMKEAAEAVQGMSKDFSKELDEPTKKLIDQIRKLSDEGSDDLKKIRKAYDDLEKAGGKATKDQIKNFRNLISEYKAFSGQRLEPTQLFEKAAAAQLKSRLAVGDLPPEMAGPLVSMQRQMHAGQISRLQQAEVDVMGGRAGGFGAGAPVGIDWTSRMKGLGKWVLGGTLVGFALQAVRQWADIDKELTKIEQRFGNIRKEVANFGVNLGYTKRESAEMAKIWGEIDNRLNLGEMGQYVGFARVRGIEPAQAMQLRMAGRYVAQAPGARRLAAFSQFAERMGMGQGRIGELIGVFGNLAQMAAAQAVGMTAGNVENLQMFTRRLWENVPGEAQRGMGVRGAEFIQRLNAGISQPGSDAARAFLMRAYGFGKGTTLTEAIERIEAGPFARGNLRSIFERLMAETPGMGTEQRIMALKGLVPQLGIKDIRQLMTVWENPTERDRVFGELQRKQEQTTKDFEKLGESAVSAGELFRTKIEDIKFDAVNDSIGEFIRRLREDGNVTLKDFGIIIKNITTSMAGLNSTLNTFQKGLDNLTILGRSPDSSFTYQPTLQLDTISIGDLVKQLRLKSTTEKK